MGRDAGNVLTDGIATYTYDALNATTGTNIGTRQFRYLYTPQDERIAAVERVNVSGVYRNRVNWTLRSLDNRVLRILLDDATSGTRVVSVKEETFWRGSALLASRTSAGTRHYGLDHLGSPRILTDTTGTAAGYQDFAPFGTGGTTNGGALQFTSHERDTANLGGGTADLPDYMHARYYRAGVGRFLSVDRISGAAVRPQSWNRYAYGRNNPVVRIDLDGNADRRALDDQEITESTSVLATSSALIETTSGAFEYGALIGKNHDGSYITSQIYTSRHPGSVSPALGLDRTPAGEAHIKGTHVAPIRTMHTHLTQGEHYPIEGDPNHDFVPTASGAPSGGDVKSAQGTRVAGYIIVPSQKLLIKVNTDGTAEAILTDEFRCMGQTRRKGAERQAETIT